MKILHCCLAAFYIDNFSYQENILPRIHMKMGHEVKIVASRETYLETLKKGFTKPGEYINKDNIPVERLPYVSWLPNRLASKVRLYKGLKKVLITYNPDIIFLHDGQFLSTHTLASFIRKSKKDITVYVDCHTDFVNSGRNWLSKVVLHKFFYKFCIKKIEPYVKKFYGTLPIRCKFLSDIYNVPLNKIELLPFGVDDSSLDEDIKKVIRNKIRKQYSLKETDIVFITGGKFDSRKNIDKLLLAFQRLNTYSSNSDIRLLLFGKATNDMQEVFEKLIDQKNIIYLEWLSGDDVKNYLLASDFAIFPGTHSVLWEEAAGLGLPLIIKKWEGMNHFDLGGNCIYLSENTIEEIHDVMYKIIVGKNERVSLINSAKEKGPNYFSYNIIAAKAISE